MYIFTSKDYNPEFDKNVGFYEVTIYMTTTIFLWESKNNSSHCLLTQNASWDDSLLGTKVLQ